MNVEYVVPRGKIRLEIRDVSLFRDCTGRRDYSRPQGVIELVIIEAVEILVRVDCSGIDAVWHRNQRITVLCSYLGSGIGVGVGKEF